MEANRLNLLREAPVVVCIWTHYTRRIHGRVSSSSLQSVPLNKRTPKSTVLGLGRTARSMAFRLWIRCIQTMNPVCTNRRMALGLKPLTRSHLLYQVKD